MFALRGVPPAYADSGIAVSEPAQTNSAIVGLDGGAATSGQILIGVIGLADADVNSVPSGWTLIGTDSFVFDGDTNIMRVYWKLAGGAEPVTYTWGLNAVGTWLASIASYDGANATQPNTAPSFTIYNSSNVTTGPSANITPTNPNTTLALAHLLRRSVTTGSDFISDPSGMTLRTNDSENNSGGFMRLGYWDKPSPAPVASGALSASVASGLRWLTMIMAIEGA